jgi:signal transduction histidine kinase
MATPLFPDDSSDSDVQDCHSQTVQPRPWDLQELERLRSEGRRLRAANRRLEDAVNARNAIIATIGQELRNPMTAIFIAATGALARLRATPALPDWVGARIESIQQHGRVFVRRSATVLEIARLLEDRVELEPSHVCLKDLVAEVLADLEPAARRAGSEVRLSSDGGADGWWDRAALEQVVFQLITNAIRYGSGQPVDVCVGSRGQVRILIVRDRGPGIALSDRARAFQSLEEAISHPPRPGFGLGLWISRRLVEAHGGSLAIESAPDGGTVFTAALPQAIHEAVQ